MNTSSGFHGLNIAPDILAALDRLGFSAPTPIQVQSIPITLAGHDLMGIAQTGTGKTLAFGVPLLQAALQGREGLVVLPTRELAIQVYDELHKIGGALGVRQALLIGGEGIGKQHAALRRGPQIVIGTPGRIVDHMQQKTLGLGGTAILVLDEADRMLDMGFMPSIRQIIGATPKSRQTLLFSATLPDEIVKIASGHMRTPTRVEVKAQGTTADNVTQELFVVHRGDRIRLLEKVLLQYQGSVLVFSRTKHGAKRLAGLVRGLGHTAAELHGNRSLAQRKDALEGFRHGTYRVLVATDIAARGIDVRGIELVINYDLPTMAEDYVHRIGRTGRAGGVGHAISFAAPDQHGEVRGIERLIKTTIPTSRLPEFLPAREIMVVQEARRAPERRSGGGPGNRSRSRSPRGSNRPSSGGGSRGPSRQGGGGGRRRPQGGGGGRSFGRPRN